MTVAIIFVALGALAMIASIQHLYYGHASLAWPKVIGEIVEVRKRERRSQSGSMRHYYEMKYSYVVNHVRFEGKRYSFNAEFPDLVFSVGAMTDVYYNPKKPKVSVLVPGYGFNNLMILGISIIFVIIGLAVLAKQNHFILK